MTRTIPIYVNLDELDLITVCLAALQYHGGVLDTHGRLVELEDAGADRVDELVKRLTELNGLELTGPA